MPAYEIKIMFETDRPLTDEELARLEGQADAQIAEPVDHDGEDLDVNVKITHASSRAIGEDDQTNS